MNHDLKEVLERVETWPSLAQEELRRAALAIERKLDGPASGPQPSLWDMMRSAPLDGVDLERRSTHPPVRDVTL